MHIEQLNGDIFVLNVALLSYIDLNLQNANWWHQPGNHLLYNYLFSPPSNIFYQSIDYPQFIFCIYQINYLQAVYCTL